MKKGILQPQRKTIDNLKRDFLFFDDVHIIQSDLEWFIDLNITDDSYFEDLSTTIADIEYLESQQIITVSDEFKNSNPKLNELEIRKRVDKIRKKSFKKEGQKLINEIDRIHKKMEKTISKHSKVLAKVQSKNFEFKKRHDLDLIF